MRSSLIKIIDFQLLLTFLGVRMIHAQIEISDSETVFYDASKDDKNNFLKDLLKSKKLNTTDSVKNIPELNIGGALRLNYSYKDLPQ